MDIKTKFSVGDNVFTLDKKTFKMKKITIGIVSAWVKDVVVVDYYAMKDIGTVDYNEKYDENVCFSSANELLSYITTQTVKK